MKGFSKTNLEYRTNNPKIGGPNQLDMLYSVKDVLKDFSGFKMILIEEVKVKLNEGLYHNGTGVVIRYIGQKLT